MATLYRKYRPQRFADVVGQDHISKTLQAALAYDRVGHAYLFAGPRGTGKTTLARLLAKAINCSKRLDIRDQGLGNKDSQSPISNPQSLVEPCNECSICLDVTDGRSLDVIEIDAASNRGIDEIRELREKIKFAPTLARAKVFIIDEVHMLTKEAFNALLKTLEEPPKHAIFVLATTEIHKVPVTISSRCQVFTFKKARCSDLTLRLQQVAAGEQLDIEPAAIDYIATLASGSYRDALSLLDQVSSVSSERLTVDGLQRILGLASFERLMAIFEAIAGQGADRTMQLLEAAEADGIDLEQLTVQLIDVGRELLHARVGHVRPIVSQDADPARWQALVSRWSVSELLTMVRTFIDARGLMKTAPTPALPLELAIVKLANSEQETANSNPDSGNGWSELREQNSAGKKENSAPTSASGNIEPAPAVQKQPVDAASIVGSIPPSSDSNPGADMPLEEDEAVPEAPEIQDTRYKIQDTPASASAWQSLMSRLRAQNPNLHGLLQQAHFGGIEGDHLIVHVPFQFAADRLSDKKHRVVIEGMLAEIFGGELALKCLVKTGSSGTTLDDGAPNPELLAAALEMFGAAGAGGD